ncbi:hypothetical protein ABB37_07191 [Leptomonas pyrrhocoris]|uniref:Uncharacterized protein n=1 Tax=Leptomonas pyrrhocoris TaxID=157538 RepID=A0A0N0VE35_LEPPY|nr:hypothetical protein ABB37_07191 [Leptomonas pyrrhocoris]KPA77302.1 hypothetical protein ABB37_07191 [Leptomonas pyrrhocoris]|eukprot:XP_015655741.1 hypothetical protein ABB37_07191 [Leptomonas pyrrhocoris]
MEFRLLPETDSFYEVLLRPTFAVSFSVMATFMIVANYIMEKSIVEQSSAPAVLVKRELAFNVLSFTLFVAGITYANSTQVTRAIALGQSPRMKLLRLRSLPWPLRDMCGAEGDRAIVPFLLYSLIFPGAVVLIALHAASLVVNGFEYALYWQMPLKRYLAWTMLWRLVITTCVFTTNYLAAHNPTQSVLVPSAESDDTQQPQSRKED